jgi:hypothetical protein
MVDRLDVVVALDETLETLAPELGTPLRAADDELIGLAERGLETEAKALPDFGKNLSGKFFPPLPSILLPSAS